MSDRTAPTRNNGANRTAALHAYIGWTRGWRARVAVPCAPAAHHEHARHALRAAAASTLGSTAHPVPRPFPAPNPHAPRPTPAPSPLTPPHPLTLAPIPSPPLLFFSKSRPDVAKSTGQDETARFEATLKSVQLQLKASDAERVSPHRRRDSPAPAAGLATPSSLAEPAVRWRPLWVCTHSSPHWLWPRLVSVCPPTTASFTLPCTTVPVQMWPRCAQSRCRCGRGEPGTGADCGRLACRLCRPRCSASCKTCAPPPPLPSRR